MPGHFVVIQNINANIILIIKNFITKKVSAYLISIESKINAIK